MAKLFVIPGHGAGDSGAVGGGYQEQERVRTLAARIKELGGESVKLADFSRNYYADDGISKLTIGKEWQILELHMDSASASARGGHVIIKAGTNADKYDRALAKMISTILPGRSETIVKRSNLANVNRAAARGYGYRLMECGFISNSQDRTIFKQRLDDIARGIVDAFEIKAPAKGLQAADLKGLTSKQVVAKVGPLFTKDQKTSGILASVSMAQFILESGYGKSELATKANNCFGMKKSLSGNAWAGSTWDGKSVYSKKTEEQRPDGTRYTITADFRKYPSVEKSIADHSAYLRNAMDGKRHRYVGIAGLRDYRKAFEAIKAGGYATGLDYVDKLCKVVEDWNLTRFDVKPDKRTYRITNKNLGVYEEPDAKSKKVGSLKKGYEFSTATRVKAANGKWWAKINAGWICMGKSGAWLVQRINI